MDPEVLNSGKMGMNGSFSELLATRNFGRPKIVKCRNCKVQFFMERTRPTVLLDSVIPCQQCGEELIMSNSELADLMPEDFGFVRCNGFVRWWKHWWQRRTRGWDDSDTWNLDSTIAKFALPRLRRFKELTCGHPGNLTAEEWDSILDDIIYGLEACILSTEGKGPEINWKRHQRGLEFFGKWFFHLWW